MKNLKNRIITILLASTLLIALVPVIPVKGVLVLENLELWNEEDPQNLIDEGGYGDQITVNATGGITAGETVRIGWDGLQAWDGETGVLNSSTAKGSGGFEVWFDVPEAVAGDHYIWLKDMDTGETVKYPNPFEVIPKIEFSSSSGLYDDKITLNGYGFADEEEIDPITFEDKYGAPQDLTTTPATPESDELGSWECTFKVPHAVYGEFWEVYAEDESANDAADDFIIGPSLTLDPEEGPVGTVVEIEGRGFTQNYEFVQGDVTIDGVDAYITKTDTVGSDLEFKIEVVIPTVSDEDGFDIIVDDGTEDGEEEFEVIGPAEIELDPEYGVQGTTVTIEGWNFTQISGKEIVIELWDDPVGASRIAEVSDDPDSESNGEFTDTFTVPAKSSDVYQIRAAQDDYNIEAFATFQIGLMIVIPTPTSGPTGTEVVLSGTGFTTGENWNATFGDITIVEDTDGTVVDTDLELAGDIPTFYVPTVDPGTYTISVLDIDSDIAVDVEWTVTATTMAEFDPSNAPNKYNVTITGSYFNEDSDEDDTDLEFILYNVTSDGKTDDEWDIDVREIYDYGSEERSVLLDEDGNFTGWYELDENDVLSLGDYILNVTADEADNIMAQAYLTIVEKSIDVETRKSNFARGETVAFNIWSTFTQPDSYIEIYDPVGDLYWTTNEFITDMWIRVGTLQTVPYYYQTAGGNTLLLLEDAPTGTWSWEWYDDEKDELASGTFTVSAASVDILSEQLTELSGDLSELATDFASVSTDVSSLASDVSSLSSSVAQAIAAANAASDAVQDVAAAVASVADTASNAATAATNAAAAATSAKEAADSAGSAASGLTNLVYGAIVASLVAALAAIVSLMQISKKIA